MGNLSAKPRFLRGMALVIVLLFAIQLTACTPAQSKIASTVLIAVTETPTSTATLVNETATPTDTATPTGTPTPMATNTPTPTETPTPEPTLTPTLTPTETITHVAEENVTRIEGLTLSYDNNNGWWQYLDSDEKPVAHFTETESGKRIEIDVDTLDFVSHPELRNLFEEKTPEELKDIEQETINKEQIVFVLPINIDDINELKRIKLIANDRIFPSLAIKLQDEKIDAYTSISGSSKLYTAVPKHEEPYASIIIRNNKEYAVEINLNIKSVDQVLKGPEDNPIATFLTTIDSHLIVPITLVDNDGNHNQNGSYQAILYLVKIVDPKLSQYTHLNALEYIFRDAETGLLITIKS